MKKIRLSAFHYSLMILIATGLRIASEPTANLSYLLIAAYALLGRAQAVQALVLSWLFSMLNPGIAAEATLTSVGRYAVLLCAAASVAVRGGILRGEIRVRRATLSTLLLGLFLVIHSFTISPVVDVSVLKAISWTIAMATLVAAWSGLNVEQRGRLAQQIFSGLTVLLVASLPLVMLPLGYLRNGTGFQGLLNHPQAFGPAMALLGAWAVSGMFGQVRPPWSLVGLVAACLVVVVLSEARTAGLALVLGVLIAVVTAPVLSARSARAVLPGLRSKRVYLIGALVLVGMVVMSARLESVVTHYLSKSGRSEGDTILAQYELSRGGLIDKMWGNIKDKPLQGIGFGIASVPSEMVVERDSVLGLPISAPIEKGVLPLAVWEELGLVGLVAVAAWLFLLLKRAARGGIAPVAVGLTTLFLNMGEAVLFSPGGMGMLCLVLVGWVVACGSQRQVVQ